MVLYAGDGTRIRCVRSLSEYEEKLHFFLSSLLSFRLVFLLEPWLFVVVVIIVVVVGCCHRSRQGFRDYIGWIYAKRNENQEKKWCHTTVWSTLQRTKIEINSFGKQVWPKQRWERVWACVCRLFIQTGWRLTCVHLSWKSVPFNLFPFRFTAAHIWRKWWVLQSCTLTQITQYLCLNKMNEQTPQNNNNTKFNENGNSSE